MHQLSILWVRLGYIQLWNICTKDTFIISSDISSCWLLFFSFSALVKERTDILRVMTALDETVSLISFAWWKIWMIAKLTADLLFFQSINQGYSSSSVILAYWARRASFLFLDSSDTSFCFTTIWACFSIILAMAWTSAIEKKGQNKMCFCFFRFFFSSLAVSMKVY